ncbi:MAG: SpoIID/LytB domain-containing protein [Candidatus Zixiibacteriota bacterium]
MIFEKIKSWLVRISLFVFMIILVWGCGRVPRIDESPMPFSRLPFVRILLDDASRQHSFISGGDQMAIDCYKGDDRYSYYSRQSVKVKSEGRKLALFTKTGTTLDYDIDRIIISPRGKNQILGYDNKQYRGLFELISISGQIKIVNIVYIEDYLLGVVPLEIGPTPDSMIESVKAQAVAARTYAMSHLGQYGDEAGYDLKSDIIDQVYGGLSAEIKNFHKAIIATKGQVAVYKDEMIDAYYHSTCGGTTDDIEDVWEKDPRPYLKMISDGDACKISKYHSWEETFTADQLVLRIDQYLSRERGNDIRIGRLIDIRIPNRTPGGRTAAITFETANGRYTFNKEKVRWVVGRSDNSGGILRSANFTLDIKKNNHGEIEEVVFHGRGYGHGVGMCQMGAKGLAAQGITYDSILSLYYQGTALKNLY